MSTSRTNIATVWNLWRPVMELPIEFVIRGGRPDTVDALREYATRRLSFALRRFSGGSDT